MKGRRRLLNSSEHKGFKLHKSPPSLRPAASAVAVRLSIDQRVK
jgi:hypothetical protein